MTAAHPARTRGSILGGMVLALVACQPAEPRTQQAAPVKDVLPAKAEVQPPTAVPEDAHRVVFADRIAYSYVLLLAPETPPNVSAPTKQELRALVQKAFPGREHEEEVELLLGLIDSEAPDEGGPLLDVGVQAGENEPKKPPAPSPAPTPAATKQAVAVANAAASEPASGEVEIDASAQEALRRKRRLTDLLGLSVAAHPLGPASPGEAPMIDPAILREPTLARDLSPAELASLDHRTQALVVRARYRNQHGVRGLRLLQTMVRLLAEQHKALIHDPDTRETLTRETFHRTRLQTKLGNVADQLPVVPFQDRVHTVDGKPGVRLTTRGMRRFGSVDLELDGLPADPAVLQQASHFLYGVAFNLIRLGEYDRSGYAIEMPDAIHVHYRDCAQAYASRNEKLPRCQDCPEEVRLHLVERPSEPQDATGHVVARVVAPRHVSDAPDYVQSKWALNALE
ncbi:MAG: hypothetical protein ACPG4T_09985, partial [Nannocystaceae bacterium]